MLRIHRDSFGSLLSEKKFGFVLALFNIFQILLMYINTAAFVTFYDIVRQERDSFTLTQPSAYTREVMRQSQRTKLSIYSPILHVLISQAERA